MDFRAIMKAIDRLEVWAAVALACAALAALASVLKIIL